MSCGVRDKNLDLHLSNDLRGGDNTCTQSTGTSGRHGGMRQAGMISVNCELERGKGQAYVFP